jgi:hypothetical protein
MHKRSAVRLQHLRPKWFLRRIFVLLILGISNYHKHLSWRIYPRSFINGHCDFDGSANWKPCTIRKCDSDDN